MLNEKNAEYLRKITEDVQRAQTHLNKTVNTRDDAVRLALEMDGKPTEIGRLTGLTRARIYQIRDGKR